MASLLGAAEDVGSQVLQKIGDIDLGKENINNMFSNLTLLSLLLTTLKGNRVKTTKSFSKKYDYIIIGGGSAGAVLASRLSQHPCVSVLLLEAGDVEPLLSKVPGFARGFLGTNIDWSYMTTPQQHCCFGQKENRVLWGSGKMLGGGSSLNAMLYVRGNKENFNEWARLGAKGWSYEEVMPYFLKLEDNMNIDEMDFGFHTEGGPIGAEKPNYNPEVKLCALEALLAMGFPLQDVNGERQFGVYDHQGTTRNQERCSTSTGYLEPASNRPNLHIVTNAFVRKILIKKENGIERAYKVLFDYDGRVHTVRLAESHFIKGGFGDIIVCNGAVRTPQTLMLSGIGPRAHLEALGIRVIADLPVGKNLMDHNAVSLLYELDPLLPNAFLQQVNPIHIAEYMATRTGPCTSTSQVTLLAFLDGLNNTSPSNDWPMQEIYFLEYNTEDAIRTLNLKEENQDVFSSYLLKPVMLCFSQILQPFSRGEITLNSIDPHEFPLIDPNYYCDERDVYYAVQGMKICNAVAKHPAMQKIKAKWVDTQRTGYPGCGHLEHDEDKYFGCIAKSVVTTIWHPAGTARMGDPEDPTSVCDPELRVIGVNNLRVAGAAVMPIITSGNTNAPTIMIAEKAYDMIKDAILCGSKLTIYKNQEIKDNN